MMSEFEKKVKEQVDVYLKDELEFYKEIVKEEAKKEAIAIVYSELEKHNEEKHEKELITIIEQVCQRMSGAVVSAISKMPNKFVLACTLLVLYTILNQFAPLNYEELLKLIMELLG